MTSEAQSSVPSGEAATVHNMYAADESNPLDTSTFSPGPRIAAHSTHFAARSPGDHSNREESGAGRPSLGMSEPDSSSTSPLGISQE